MASDSQPPMVDPMNMPRKLPEVISATPLIVIPK